MGEKIIFSEVPSMQGWQPFLKEMEIRVPKHFRNIDNVANNGRQAIKRYYANVKKGKCKPRIFKTATNTELHTFTIIRKE